MKKSIFALCFMAILLLTSTAKAHNIAYLDLHAVVDKSSEVKRLKQVRQEKLHELHVWYTNKIATEADKKLTNEAKNKVIQKYIAQTEKKKREIYKEYKANLIKVEQDIANIIEQKSKEMGYDMVLYKSVVRCGGDDITEEIRKYIK